MTRVIEVELFNLENYFQGNSTQECDSKNTYNTKCLYSLMACNSFSCNGFFCNGFSDFPEKVWREKLTGKVIALENNVYN